jgi:hypothetical protein
VFSLSIVWQNVIPSGISVIVICLHVTVQIRLYTLMRKAVIYDFVWTNRRKSQNRYPNLK